VKRFAITIAAIALALAVGPYARASWGGQTVLSSPDVQSALRHVVFIRAGADDAAPTPLNETASMVAFGVWMGVAVVIARTGREYRRWKITSLVFLPPLAIAAVDYFAGTVGDPSRVYPGAVVAVIGALMYEVGYRFDLTRLAAVSVSFGLSVLYAWLATASSTEAIACSAVMAAVQYIWSDAELRFYGYTYRWKCRNS
jgi:hypothetical protein